MQHQMNMKLKADVMYFEKLNIKINNKIWLNWWFSLDTSVPEGGDIT